MKCHFVLLSLLFAISTALAGEIDCSKKAVIPVKEENPWVFALSIPGWAAGVTGDVGVGNSVSYVNIVAASIIPKIDMAAMFRGEVSKGRFGVMSDFIYLSLSDGVGTKTIVNKVDLRVDETIGQLALRWRMLEDSRGSLDIYGGVRYLSIYNNVAFQPNPERINERSAELVNALGTGLSGSDIRDRVEEILRPEVNPLLGRGPTLPVPPLGSDLRGEILDRITKIVAGRKDELLAAIKDLDAAATAALKAKAQAHIDEIKNDLTKKIARTLESKIDRSISLNYWWLDPFIGLRGRWNLNHAWYLTARGDVGGFGLGSEFSWEAEAALGCQLTRNIFAEAGYRTLGIDYANNGIINNTITHGAQILFGVNF